MRRFARCRRRPHAPARVLGLRSLAAPRAPARGERELEPNVEPRPVSLSKPMVAVHERKELMAYREPEPVPPKRRVVDPSACTNGWNKRSRTRPGCRSRCQPPRRAPCAGALLAGHMRTDEHLASGREFRRCDEVREDLAIRVGSPRTPHHVRDPRRPPSTRARVRGRRPLGKQCRDLLAHAGAAARRPFACREPGFDLREVEDVFEDRQERLGARADGRRQSRVAPRTAVCRGAARSCPEARRSRPYGSLANVREKLALQARGLHGRGASALEVACLRPDEPPWS